MQYRPSPNHDDRSVDVSVDMLVLHYTGMQSGQEALDRLCDGATRVSAHYLIDEDGHVWLLVPEDRRAWHAGVAGWRGRSDINARSIGIELVNPGHEFGIRPFPEPQMVALIDLCRDILNRFSIPATHVVGHSDIAPNRKQDPGEMFDWPRLAQAGIGQWPNSCPPLQTDPARALQMLQEIGYETDDPQKTIEAFQRRYRPQLIDGIIDADTAGRITAVLAISS